MALKILNVLLGLLALGGCVSGGQGGGETEQIRLAVTGMT